MATINDLHRYLAQLIEQGDGEKEVKKEYDGRYDKIEDPAKILRKADRKMIGPIAGKVNKGDYYIEE